MTNKKKIKILKEKINKIDSLSKDYEQGVISSKLYESFLKSEIESIKSKTINDLKVDIEENMKEIVFLNNLKHKVKNNLRLTTEESEYILLHL